MITIILANGVDTFFISSKPTLIDSSVILHEISLFARDLIIFIVYFTSFFVCVIPDSSLCANPLLSIRILVFPKYFVEFLANIGAQSFTTSAPPLTTA